MSRFECFSEICRSTDSRGDYHFLPVFLTCQVADADHICPPVVRVHREARHGAMEEDTLRLEEVRDFQDLGLSADSLMGYGNTNNSGISHGRLKLGDLSRGGSSPGQTEREPLGL